MIPAVSTKIKSCFLSLFSIIKGLFVEVFTKLIFCAFTEKFVFCKSTEQQADDFTKALKHAGLEPITMTLPEEGLWIICRDQKEAYFFMALSG